MLRRSHLGNGVLELRELLGEGYKGGEHVVAVAAPGRPKIDHHLQHTKQSLGQGNRQRSRQALWEVSSRCEQLGAGSRELQRGGQHRFVSMPLQQLLQLIVGAHSRHVGEYLADVRLAHGLQGRGQTPTEAESAARAAAGGGLAKPTLTCSLSQDTEVNLSAGGS